MADYPYTTDQSRSDGSMPVYQSGRYYPSMGGDGDGDSQSGACGVAKNGGHILDWRTGAGRQIANFKHSKSHNTLIAK